MKVLKKHLKYLNSVSVYPNGLIYTFSKSDKETGVTFDYYIRVKKQTAWHNHDDTMTYNRLYFSFYSNEQPCLPLDLITIRYVSVYADNATKKQKEAGIKAEYVRVVLDNGIVLTSKHYSFPDDTYINNHDTFSYSQTYNDKHLDTYSCIHEITI
jgi:hypothetical protein